MATLLSARVQHHEKRRPSSFLQKSESELKSSLASLTDEKHFPEIYATEVQVLPPKDLICSPPEQADDGDFPDGGLRAWLVVVGVCMHAARPRSPAAQQKANLYFFWSFSWLRRCATSSQRE